MYCLHATPPHHTLHTQAAEEERARAVAEAARRDSALKAAQEKATALQTTLCAKQEELSLLSAELASKRQAHSQSQTRAEKLQLQASAPLAVNYARAHARARGLARARTHARTRERTLG